MNKIIFVAIALSASLSAASVRAAESHPAPMDAAAGENWLPDTVTEDGIHIGSWSANSAKTPAQPKAPLPPKESASFSPDEEKYEGGHTVVVTSIQTCYDQLDPADVSDIKMNYPKPYAECQARLEAKHAGKREWKAGEAASAATPETPRNYIRVQQPDTPSAAETPNKSTPKPNP
jgi:hypothetical protein